MPLSETLLIIIHFLGDQWKEILGFLTSIWIWWFRHEWMAHKTMPTSDTFRVRIVWLRRTGWGAWYRYFLGRILAGFEWVFGEMNKGRTEGRTSVQTKDLENATGLWFGSLFGCQPFTAKSYERCLMIAFLYPILFVVFSWTLGGSGELGQFVLLEPAEIWKRAFVGIALIVIPTLLARGQQIDGLMSWAYLIPGGVLMLLVILSDVFDGAFAFAFTFFVAFAGAFPFAFSGGLPFAFFGVFAFVVTLAASAPIAFVGAFPFAFSFAFSFFFSVAFAFAARGLYDRAQDFQHPEKWLFVFWIVFNVLVFALGLLSLWDGVMFGEGERLGGALSMLLFLCFLPLANAPLDWFSTGITRGLLNGIHSRRHQGFTGLFWALMDVVMAGVLLILVAATTLGVVMLVNALSESWGGPLVLDLHWLWWQLQDGPIEDHLWVYLLLFSTLIPTAIHFLVAVFALFTSGPSKRLKTIAKKMRERRKMELPSELNKLAEQGSKGSGRLALGDDDLFFASAYRSVTPVLAVFVGVFLVGVAGISLVHYIPLWIGAFLDWLIWI